MTTPRKIATRASDERILEWLRLQEQGWTNLEIATKYGVTKTAVQRITAAVRKEM